MGDIDDSLLGIASCSLIGLDSCFKKKEENL
jgi:hypothetical protein